MKIQLFGLLLLLSTTLSALELDTISGEARFNYGSSDQDGNLFSQEHTSGQFAFTSDLDMNISKTVTSTIGVTYLTTLGIENFATSHVYAGGTTKDQLWVDEVHLDFDIIEETSTIIGRQYIDSPLLYSNDWNIVSNSMDGAYFLDEHLSQTKLMGFWVGRVWSNDYNASTDSLNFAGNYKTFGDHGAFGVGAQTEIIPTVKAELWYYDVSSVSQSLWAEVESDFSGVSLGLQVASTKALNSNRTSGYALQAKYTTDIYNISASFSQMIDKGDSSIVNLAGLFGDGSKSPLYTEAWWNWGYVGESDATAFALKSEATLAQYNLGAYLTMTQNGSRNADTLDLTLNANRSFDAFNMMLVYVYIQREDYNNADGYNTAQMYLTYSF